jgi:alpha-tubulin suppressor-like RCC1 family protein
MVAVILLSALPAKAQTPPFILQGPQSQIVAQGSNVTFFVIASGSSPLLYQWQFNGTNLTDDSHISGSTSSNLIVSNAAFTDAGAYSVIISNSISWTTSTNAQLTVLSGFTLGEATDNTNLVWETDPANPWTWENVDTHDGMDAAQSGSMWWISSYMQTTVEGPASVNFWWRASFHPSDHMAILVDSNELARVSGNTAWENKSVYVPSGSHPIQWLFSKDQPFGTYNLEAYVDQVTITPPTLPAITSAPTNQSIPAGNNLTLSASVSGMLPIAYQWQFNGTNLDGATNSALLLSDLQYSASGSYTLVVSNGAGTVTSSPAILTVVPSPPTVTQPPFSQTGYYGISTSFSVAATGTEPLSYQWQFNGTNLDGATGTTLTITNPQPASAGPYQVVVSNSVGIAISPSAIFTINDPAPSVLPLPASKSVFQGGSTSIVASATGYALRYQWRLNGTNLAHGSFVSGATGPTLTLPKARTNQSGSYSVIVSNSYGVVSSSKCDVTVLEASGWGAVNSPAGGGNVDYGQAIIPAGLTGIKALSGGRYHSLALKNDGTVVAWGAVTNPPGGQVAFGQSIVPPGLNNVTAISAGGYHSLALKSDGTVIAWGAGTNRVQNSTVHYGQSQVPTNLSNVKAIAAGAYHSLALKNDGTVVSWGYQTNVPPNLTNVTAIAAGFAHNLALLSNGLVVAWGTNTFGQTNVPFNLSNVVAIVAGDNHCLALKSDGSIVSWGKQLSSPPFTTDFAEIAAGGDHSIGVRTNGIAYAWGFSGNNLLPVPQFPYVIGVAAGYVHDLVLLGDGSPVIKYSPANRAAFSRENVTLNVLPITGTQFPMSFQWRFNGTNFIGATKASLTLPNVQYTNAGSYVVVITNSYGSVTSAPILLSVTTPVATTNLGLAVDATNFVWATSGNAPWFGQSNIVHGPGIAAQSGSIGDSQQSSLQTTIIGPGRISFWWQVSSEEYFDYLNFYIGGTFQAGISGSSGWIQQTFQVPPGSQTLEWRYVKDSSTSVGQDAGWLDQVVFTPAPPLITSQPQSQSVLFGGTAQFTVQASGTPPLTYRWTMAGTTLSGATNATLTLTNVVRTNAANYAVVVSNSGGATTSSNATLTVRVPQQIASPQPLTNGTFQLLSGYADNWPLQPGDLTRFDALASTNLQDWILLTNALSLTNGQLLLQDDAATNWPTRYYRIVEH